MTNLANDPRYQLWAHMGKVSSEFAKLDHYVKLLYARLLDGEDDTPAVRDFERRQNISAKLELLRIAMVSHAKSAEPIEPHERTGMLQAVRELADIRNNVAHGIATISVGTGFPRPTPMLVFNERSGERGIYTVSHLVRIAALIEAASTEIAALIRRVSRETGHPSGTNPSA